MKQVIFEVDRINGVALSDALQQAIGSNFLGYSTRRGEVVVHLANQTPRAQVGQVRQILREHDPSVLTQAQQDDLERQQRLQQAREQNNALLDLLLYTLQPEPIKALARKIYWLEQELRLLRRDDSQSLS